MNVRCICTYSQHYRTFMQLKQNLLLLIRTKAGAKIFKVVEKDM
jgi:hypothetical protein